jgi:hypothetical protein
MTPGAGRPTRRAQRRHQPGCAGLGSSGGQRGDPSAAKSVSGEFCPRTPKALYAEQAGQFLGALPGRQLDYGDAEYQQSGIHRGLLDAGYSPTPVMRLGDTPRDHGKETISFSPTHVCGRTDRSNRLSGTAGLVAFQRLEKRRGG